MNKRLTLRKFIKHFPCIAACGVLVFLLTFMVNKMFVNAASEQTYFPMGQNHNNLFTETYINHISSVYNTDDNLVLACFTSRYNGGYFYMDTMYIITMSNNGTNTLYGIIDANGYNWGVSLASSDYHCYRTVYDSYTGTWANYGASISDFSNLTSNVYSSSVDYISNFNVVSYSNHTKGVLWYDELIFVPEGSDPTAPDMSNLDLDSSLNITNIPTTPSFHYTFNDPRPTWDANEPIQSVIYFFMWGFDRLHSFLVNFLEYLSSWFTYFINILTYLIQKIIDAIKYVVSWLYNQFLNWLTPYLKILSFIAGILFNDNDQLSIYDVLVSLKDLIDTKLDNLFSGTFFSSFWNNFSSYVSDRLQYFSKIVLFFTTLVALGTDPTTNEFSVVGLLSALFVPTSTQVVQVVLANDSLDLITLVNAVFSKEVTIVNQIHGLTPAKTFHVPSLIYHGVQIGNFDIDFSWFEPYKSYSDAIISVFLILGWLYWLLVSVSHLLRGVHGQGESVTAADNYAAGWHYDL